MKRRAFVIQRRAVTRSRSPIITRNALHACAVYVLYVLCAEPALPFMRACPAAGALWQLPSGGEEPHSAAQLEPPDAASAETGALMFALLGRCFAAATNQQPAVPATPPQLICNDNSMWLCGPLGESV
jgi:hypothetical protein